MSGFDGSLGDPEERLEEEVESGGPEKEKPAGESGGKRVPVLIGVGALLLVAVGAFLFLRSGNSREEGPADPAPDPLAGEAAESPEAPEGPDLPALDESDPLLRNLLRALTERPEALEWLLTDEIARRIAIATDNVADGVSPRRALRRLAPAGGFRTRTTEAGLEPHPESHARYDGIAAVIAEADMTAVVAALDQVTPLMEEAYAELGRSDRDFTTALLLAIERLMAVPVPQVPILLREQTLRYEYLEEAIEDLDPASKHLVRFGPTNQQRIQQALAPLAEHLRAGQ